MSEIPQTRRTALRRWLQFRLRTLLLGMMLVAVVLGVLRREVVGHLRLGDRDEGETLFEILTSFHDGPSMAATLEFSSEAEVSALRDSYDPKRYVQLAQEYVGQSSPEAAPALDGVTVWSDIGGIYWFSTYDCKVWGRSRFDLRERTYVFDQSDPEAKRRNEAVSRAFQAAQKTMRIENRLRIAAEYRRLGSF